MIPKVIHYCWFGGGEKSELANRCISSWKKYCPDWEIKEWNETNFDISQCKYICDAYEQKKWAFVADPARAMVIYEWGGVYLDTDVELLAPINELLNYHSFFAFESIRRINLGMGFGAEKGNPIIKKIVESYIRGDVPVGVASPHPNTKVLCTVCPKLILNGAATQIVDEGLFLSTEKYHEFANHLGAMSWIEGVEHDPTKRKKRKKSKLGRKIQKCLKDYKKFEFVKKHFGEKGERIYTFFAYDFFDSGIRYFVKRKICKIKKKLYGELK